MQAEEHEKSLGGPIDEYSQGLSPLPNLREQQVAVKAMALLRFPTHGVAARNIRQWAFSGR